MNSEIVRSGKNWVALVAAVLLIAAFSASAFAQVTYMLNKPPITIINPDPKWQVKVWAYEFGGSTAVSCQTLNWSTERKREIEPKVLDDVYDLVGAWLIFDHCGSYSTLSLWFRVYHNDTGETKDFDLTHRQTSWGDTWTWNGREWSCSGMGCR